MFSFLKPPTRHEPDPELTSGWYTEVEIVWPTGTWDLDLPKGASPEEMDHAVRCELLCVWAREEFGALEATLGRELNPGMMGAYPPPIPGGWKPSKKVLKAYAKKNNWDPKYIRYVTTRLERLGKLRP